MLLEEAKLLIKDANIPVDRPQTWVDLGCGDGIFSYALASLLPPHSSITCVDKTDQKLKQVFNGISLHFQKTDFENHSFLERSLSGILMANAIHYIKDKEKFILRMKNYLEPVGQWIIVEYDTDKANRWVPFPLSFLNLKKLFTQMGYNKIRKVGEHPSIYRREAIYACEITAS